MVGNVHRRLSRGAAAGGLLALAAVAITLLALETGLRLFAPQTFFMEGAFRDDPAVGLRHVPHYRGRSRVAEYDVAVATNSLGFRGPEVAPRGGGVRIVALGDSFTFGLGVAEEDTFAARLGRRWSARGVEVINAGQVDMGPENEWRLLEDEGPRLRPDVILLGFYVGNDVRDVMLGLRRARIEDGRLLATPQVRRWYRPLEPGRLLAAVDAPAEPSAAPGRLKRALRRHSHLYRFLSGRVAALRKRLRGGQAPVFTVLDDEAVCIREEPAELRAGWDRAEAALLRIAGWCRAHGAAPVLVVIPSASQVDDARWQEVRRRYHLRAEDFDLDKPQRRLRSFAAASGLPVVDLLPALRRAAAEPGPRLYYARDPHWTPRGHAVAAEEIATAVEALGLLQRP